MTSPSRPILSVVVPAHNEVAVIDDVIDEIVAVAAELAAANAFEVLVVDDASTDGTSERLDDLAARHDALRVIHLAANVGHGPALRHGWEAASGEWIAHLDSDGEIDPGELAALWSRRADADLVLGVRRGRTDSLQRRAVTFTLRGVARLAAGRALGDANTPCKLVRATALEQALAVMPADAFAPSVLLAVATARRGGRIAEVEVRARPRMHGRSWLVPTRLAAGAARSTRDTFELWWTLRR